MQLSAGLSRQTALTCCIIASSALGCFVDRSGIGTSGCTSDADCGLGICVDAVCQPAPAGDSGAAPDSGRDGGLEDGGGAQPDAQVHDAGGDGGTPFDPRTLGGLALWLRADNLPAGPVATWPDESGNGRDAVAAPSPLALATTADAQYVVLDGTSHFTVPAFQWGAGVTLFLVVRLDSAGSDSARYVASDYSQMLFYRNRDNVELSADSARRATSGLHDAWHLWTVISRPGAGTTELYRDQAVSPAATVNASIPETESSMGLGGNPPGVRPGADILTGDVAEFLLYNTELSTPQADSVRSYLTTKWGSLLDG